MEINLIFPFNWVMNENVILIIIMVDNCYGETKVPTTKWDWCCAGTKELDKRVSAAVKCDLIANNDGIVTK